MGFLIEGKVRAIQFRNKTFLNFLNESTFILLELKTNQKLEKN